MLNLPSWIKNYKSPEGEFKPYYEKENDFRRLVVIHSIAAFIISPIFCLLVYKSELPEILFYLGISYTVLFPIYMLICWVIPFMRDKLIYFFILHLFGMTYFSFLDLVYNKFELVHFVSFYCLYAVTVFVMQRLYPVILYNLMVVGLLVYGFQFIEYPEISQVSVFGMVIVLGLCSVVVLYSRQKMIHSVEDYSIYLKKIVNTPGTGYVLFQETRKGIELKDYNQQSLQFFKVEKEEELEQKIIAFTDEKLLKQLKNLNETSSLSKETKIKIKDVTTFEKDIYHLDISISPLHMKNGHYYLMKVVDITNKIKEKEELVLSEEKYRNLYFKNQAGVFTLDAKATILDFNETFDSMFEHQFTRGDHFCSEDKQASWDQVYELLVDAKQIRNYQTHFTLSNGHTKWFVFNWFLDVKTNKIEGTVVDLTEVQKATTALKQSEEKYRLIYEESNDTILLLDKDKIIDVNRKGIQLFGIGEKDLLNTNLFDLSLNTSEDSFRQYRKFKQKLHLSRSTKFNWVFNGNGDKIEAEVAIIELELEEKLYYQCVIHDVTERNETIRSLDKSRKNFESVLDNTPEGILIVKKDKILYANKEVYNLLEQQEVDLSSLFSEKDQEKFERLFQDQQEDKGIFQSQFNLINSTGSNVLVDVTMVSITFAEQEATLMIFKDISLQTKLSKEVLRAEFAEETNKRLEKEIKERIEAENRLKNLLLKTKAIFESSSNTFLMTLDKSFAISSFNIHTESYFSNFIKDKLQEGINYKAFFKPLFSENDLRYFNILLKKVVLGEPKRFESKFIYKNKEHWLELFINAIKDVDGNVSEISMVAHDITEKKKAEQEIVDSLKEKEVLLKEIHHRVKNNLQVISSILNLQSSFVHDEKILDVLQESRNRIRSMAIIHENLYRTTNFSSINFTSYILNLATNLVASYRISESKVELKYDMDQLDLVLDQAIPCGLLVNELITNAIKYAFPDENKGHIVISLKEKKDRIFLSIKDDGVGLPDDFEIESSDTLGLQLVLTLVEQLDGELKFNKTEGTEFLINFEKTKQ